MHYRLEVEALELSRERSVLADSVTARQELLTKCGLSSTTVPSDSNSDTEFYAANQLEVSLDNSCYLDGTVDRFIDVSIYDDDADDDADDEDAEDSSDTGRLSSRDSYDLSDVHVTCSPRDSQVSQCYNCPDCKRPKNRQSGSSDSGNVSDDSKISSLALDALSFTDSAISSLSSQENDSACHAATCCPGMRTPVSPQKANLWKTESTDTESDIFTSREVYAKQLRKNSKIIRSASIKRQHSANGASVVKKDHMPLYKPIESPTQNDHLNAKIIETLV